MLAIVDLNGKQYQVEEGRYVTVDRLALDENETFELANVLMIVDGEASLVGAPFVEGATVKAKVLRHSRGPKILVYKMRCKKGYRRKNGHRQDFTQLQIEVVDFPGKKDRPAKPAKEEAAEKPKKAAKKSDDKAETKKPKASAKTADKAAEPKKEKKAPAPKAEKAPEPAEEVKVQPSAEETVEAPQAAETQPETAAEENTEA